MRTPAKTVLNSLRVVRRPSALRCFNVRDSHKDYKWSGSWRIEVVLRKDLVL